MLAISCGIYMFVNVTDRYLFSSDFNFLRCAFIVILLQLLTSSSYVRFSTFKQKKCKGFAENGLKKIIKLQQNEFFCSIFKLRDKDVLQNHVLLT